MGTKTTGSFAISATPSALLLLQIVVTGNPRRQRATPRRRRGVSRSPCGRRARQETARSRRMPPGRRRHPVQRIDRSRGRPCVQERPAGIRSRRSTLLTSSCESSGEPEPEPRPGQGADVGRPPAAQGPHRTLSQPGQHRGGVRGGSSPARGPVRAPRPRDARPLQKPSGQCSVDVDQCAGRLSALCFFNLKKRRERCLAMGERSGASSLSPQNSVFPPPRRRGRRGSGISKASRRTPA